MRVLWACKSVVSDVLRFHLTWVTGNAIRRFVAVHMREIEVSRACFILVQDIPANSTLFFGTRQVLEYITGIADSLLVFAFCL
jgi:hypothetical protein